MMSAIVGFLCGIALFLILADIFSIPYFKTSKAICNLSKREKTFASGLNIWINGIAEWLARHIRINEFKREQLESDLKTAQMDISPEMLKANAIVKATMVGALAIPLLFIFPLFCLLVLFIAVFVYNDEMKSVSKRIKTKRRRIEYELPRFVFTIEKTLKHNRDILYMIESHAENAGLEMKHELLITAADMRSGNYEAAITRLEARVGSSMMSDVCRGLISILRGDETAMYWASLSIKFSDIQRQQLRLQAQKVPRKVKKLSMCLLFCFMMMYIVVILLQIMSSISALFGG